MSVPAQQDRLPGVPADSQARQFAASCSRAVLSVLGLGALLATIGDVVEPGAGPAWPLWAAGAAALLVVWALRSSSASWTDRPELRLGLLALVSGIFGLAASLYLARGGPLHELLAFTFVLVAAAVTISEVAYARAAIAAWTVPMMLPAGAALLVRGGALERWLALALAIFLLFALRRGALMQRLMMATAAYRSENERLVAQLRDQMALAVLASEEKSRFIAAAAHDLRQPLHALGLFASSFEQRMRDSPDWPLLRSMLRAIEALENSFAAILDISRLDSGAVKPNLQIFPVRDLFRRMYLQFAGDAEQRGISLRFRAGGCVIRSDPQLLERVVSNLIQNALRYTETGGVLVAARRFSRGVRIEIWDSGIGIPGDKLDMIFREFYQIDNPERDRTRGLGMGLAIVRRICKLLDHAVDVRSTPGRGSIFRVTVPIVYQDVPQDLQLTADTLPPMPVRQLTVLVIDDEEAIREAMREFLSRQQFRVLTAATIAEAVEHAKSSQTRIDVIVSDLRLRGEEDGIQAIGEVRRLVGAGTPAILLTGDTSSDRLRVAHQIGLVIVYKPIGARQILDMIDRLPI